jgi:hypothetical protein
MAVYDNDAFCTRGLEMSRPQLLGVLLKTMGIWFCIKGVAALPMVFPKLHDYSNDFELFRMIAVAFAVPGIRIISGCFLFFATDWLVRVAFLKGNSIDDAIPNDEGPHGLFAVLLKAMGFWFIVSALEQWPMQMSYVGYEGTFIQLFLFSAIYPGIWIVASIFLIVATNVIVRMGYPVRTVSDDQSSGET